MKEELNDESYKPIIANSLSRFFFRSQFKVAQDFETLAKQAKISFKY